MSLKDIELKVAYDSDEDDILNSFYIPTLSQSLKYYRLTGFFSSTSLALSALGIINFINNGGEMKLVASIKINRQDKEAIEKGIEKPEEVISKFMTDGLDEMKDEFIKDHLAALAWMVATKKLEIKVAIMTDKHGAIACQEDIEKKGGIFHQKVGLLEDKEGNILSFSGSVNETAFGWTGNIETFDVFRSWVGGETDHLSQKRKMFEKFWDGRTKRAIIYDMPDAIRDKIIQMAPRNLKEFKTLSERITERLAKRNRETNDSKEDIENEANIKKEWEHKKKAIDIFMKKGNGIIEMATGTGKTSVAISILNLLFQTKKINGAIVATDGIDLLDQWYDELIKSNIKFKIYRNYNIYHELNEFIINHNSSILLIGWDRLNIILEKDEVVASKLLICDEVHGFGSESLRNKLKGKVRTIKYRLGLSATSERFYDEIGNKFINEEIGPIIFKYGLEDAIRDGILCEFDYIPLTYHYTKEDRERSRKAYKKYYARIKNSSNEKKTKIELYMDIAEVRKVSKDKIYVFKDFIKNNLSILDNSIIFVETMEYGKLVQDIIINYNSDFHTYYADDEKENLLKFSKGEFKFLITCKRISQGINIRSIKNIILFSSSRAKLETVQRIGRCLRTDPKNPNKRATVLDFILSKEEQTDGKDYEDSDESRKLWLIKVSKTKKRI